MWADYQWIVVLGGMVAFVMAYGIGANDVANAFATSVGSKTLTLRQALVIAAVMEFVGALALGAHVTNTIAGSIAKRTAFTREPEVLMYGMLCALTAASIWLLLATYLELPVSTTHSIVGAVLGMALAWNGADAVVWRDSDPEFPYVKGFVVIVISWFISPIVSGVAAALFFLLTRNLILRRKNSYKLAFWALPVIVALCVFVMLFFVLYKGAQRKYDFSMGFCAWVSAAVAGGCFLITAVGILPILRKRLDAMDLDGAAPGGEVPVAGDMAKTVDIEDNASSLSKLKTAALRGVDYNIFKVIEEDPIVAALHERAEKFDPKTEEAFKYVQVFTAMADSFSHGANDVANAIGPFAAIWTIYNRMEVTRTSEVPTWILGLGGVGIVVGLGTYGYNIMRALGVSSVAITPSRGYCIELSSALVIAIGSKFGLPLSTTHCQVGGTYGVGLVEGISGTNYRAFLKFFAGWIMTVIVAGFLSGIFFLQGTAAPSRLQSRTIRQLEDGVQNVTSGTIKLINSTNYKFNKSALFNSSLNSTLAKEASSISKLYKKQNIPAADIITYLRRSNALYRNSSVLVLGDVVCAMGEFP